MLKVSVKDQIRTQSMQMNSPFKTVVYQDMMLSQESKLLSNYRAELRSKVIFQKGNREKLMIGRALIMARIQERNRALLKFQ